MTRTEGNTASKEMALTRDQMIDNAEALDTLADNEDDESTYHALRAQAAQLRSQADRS